MKFFLTILIRVFTFFQFFILLRAFNFQFETNKLRGSLCLKKRNVELRMKWNKWWDEWGSILKWIGWRWEGEWERFNKSRNIANNSVSHSWIISTLSENNYTLSRMPLDDSQIAQLYFLSFIHLYLPTTPPPPTPTAALLPTPLITHSTFLFLPSPIIVSIQSGYGRWYHSSMALPLFFL